MCIRDRDKDHQTHYLAPLKPPHLLQSSPKVLAPITAPPRLQHPFARYLVIRTILDLNGAIGQARKGGLLKFNYYSDPNMRFNALLMVALIASMSGSIAYTSNSVQIDKSKMSNELISELD